MATDVNQNRGTDVDAFKEGRLLSMRGCRRRSELLRLGILFLFHLCLITLLSSERLFSAGLSAHSYEYLRFLRSRCLCITDLSNCSDGQLLTSRLEPRNQERTVSARRDLLCFRVEIFVLNLHTSRLQRGASDSVPWRFKSRSTR